MSELRMSEQLKGWSASEVVELVEVEPMLLADAQILVATGRGHWRLRGGHTWVDPGGGGLTTFYGPALGKEVVDADVPWVEIGAVEAS